MKDNKLLIDYGSDLHLEFGGWNNLAIERISNPGSTVCILAGDIIPVVDLKGSTGFSKSAFKFFRELNSRYEKIIYILGNHCHWRNHFYFTVQNLRDRLKENGLDNFVVLENQTFEFGGVEFFGATMWTSLRNANPIAVNDAETFMNDYQEIHIDKYHTHSTGKLRAEHTMAEHAKTYKQLKYFANKESSLKKVVVTHMAPSALSISPYFKTSAINDAYYEELHDLIYGSNIIRYIHGHIHDSVNYTIGDTIVSSNPRGYSGSEAQADIWKFEQFEI